MLGRRVSAGDARPLLEPTEDGYDDSLIVDEGNVKATTCTHDPLQAQDIATAPDQDKIDVRNIKTYRRWFGVAIIALLNFMTAFSIVIFAPIATITQQHLNLASLTPVNWLYISGAFTYVPASIASIFVTQHSTKSALMLGSLILILGSWLRFVGTTTQSYICVLLGSMLCGASQAFALNIPSHFSNLWFLEGERVTATALMSLANPLGQAIGTLVVPFMATSSSEVSSMTLHVAILFTVTTSFALVTLTQLRKATSSDSATFDHGLMKYFLALIQKVEFYYIFFQFTILVAAFNAFATLVEQFTRPYNFSDVQAGIIGAVLVVIGLISGVVTSPILDKTKAYKLPIIFCIVASAISYLALVFVIKTYTTGVFIAVLILAGIIGGSGLVLLPLALELATAINLPAPPEMASAALWMAGQALGGIFILVMDALRTEDSKYTHSMIFLIFMTSLPVPFAIALVRSKNMERSWAQHVGLVRSGA